MRPKVIKTQADYDEALSRIDEIFAAEPGSPEEDELELLTVLVERYESELYPIEHPDPISAIKFRMEQQGLKQKDLVPFFGSKSKVSEVLSGRRSFTLSMIDKLVNELGIPAGVFFNNGDKKAGERLNHLSFIDGVPVRKP